MDVNTISSLATLLVALSIASERLVEIIKGIIPSLAVEQKDEKQERRRKSAIQAIAVLAGIGTTFLVSPILPSELPDTWLSKLGIGLIASGGSGFWNSIQGYVAQAKEVKKAEVEEVKTRTTEQINYQRSRK